MQPRSVADGSLIVVVLGVLMVLVGCGPLNDLDPGGKSEEVTLGAKDNGGQVELHAGQILVITLESNPTTGFRWDLVEVKEAVLRPEGEAEFKMASEPEPLPPGTGGVEIFRFEAVAVGETWLTLIYHQPWEEGTQPLATYSIQVTVR